MASELISSMGREEKGVRGEGGAEGSKRGKGGGKKHRKSSVGKFSRTKAWLVPIESVNSGEKNGGIRRALRGQVDDLVSWVLVRPLPR